MTINPPLPVGYSPIAPGQVANVVTCLEMRARPPAGTKRGFPGGVQLVRVERPDPGRFLALYRRIGDPWLWFSRVVMPREELLATIQHPQVEVSILWQDDADIGLLELDFRQAGECELTFFGLAPEAVGAGLGRAMMDAAIDLAWRAGIGRFWVHTCHLDHPAALPFYQRSGFTPYAFMVEVVDDPRLTGHLPRSAGPHVPLIDPAA